jgi:hypothetical protein
VATSITSLAFDEGQTITVELATTIVGGANLITAEEIEFQEAGVMVKYVNSGVSQTHLAFFPYENVEAIYQQVAS